MCATFDKMQIFTRQSSILTPLYCVELACKMTYVKFLQDVPSGVSREQNIGNCSVSATLRERFSTVSKTCCHRSSCVVSDLCCDSSVQLEKELLHGIRGEMEII